MTITACLCTHIGEFAWPCSALPITDLLRQKGSVADAVGSVAAPKQLRQSRALQDLFTPQVPDAIEEYADRVEAAEAGAAVALQDLLNAEAPWLSGLVAHLFQPALQDNMASTTRPLGLDRQRCQLIARTCSINPASPSCA
jgi:hypothetical protein